MKRKWVSAAALLLVIVGFLAVRKMVNKRPHVFTVVDYMGALTFSPDGTRLFVRRGDDGGQLIDVKTKNLTLLQLDYYNPTVFFSADNETLFQLHTYGYSGFVDDVGADMRQPEAESSMLYSYDTSTGEEKGHYALAPVEPSDFYGATLRNTELVCESRTETRRIDTRSSRTLAVTARQRFLKNATLLPDGQTLWTEDAANFYFWDLRTQKKLWNWPKTNLYDSSGVRLTIHSSQDGRLALAIEGKTLTARDVRTGETQWWLYGPQSDAFAFSPDARSIFEARPDGQIWVWPV